jgi:hypothetical protein
MRESKTEKLAKLEARGKHYKTKERKGQENPCGRNRKSLWRTVHLARNELSEIKQKKKVITFFLFLQ